MATLMRGGTPAKLRASLLRQRQCFASRTGPAAAASFSQDHSPFCPLYSVQNDTERRRLVSEQLQQRQRQQRRWANTSSGFFAPSTLADRQRAAHSHPTGPSSVLDDNEHLPSLHVPELASTLEKLKESISPVAMNSAEFVSTLQLIDEFAESAGPKLDLVLRAKAAKTKNWLTLDWWTSEIYLKSRQPLVISSNPSMIYPPLPFEVNNQLALTSTISMLVSGIIDFRQALIHGYNPEATSAHDECHLDPNLCYSQYKHMFGSTRLPGLHADSQSLKHLTDGVGDSVTPFTIVISFRGRYFEIQLKDIDNERSRIDQIAGILDKIIVSSELDTPNAGVGVLTTTDRDKWATSYKLLDTDSMNAIKEAQFVVCIDTIAADEPDGSSSSYVSSLLSEPIGSDAHLAALGRQVLHGDTANVGNRWFDKSFQLVVVADSKAERLLGAGINYEHSFAEGTVVTKMIEYSHDKTVQKNRESSQSNYYKKQQFSSQEPALFRQLRMFDESKASEISELIEQAALDFSSRVQQFDLSYFRYKQYGSNAIKSWRFSPDSWFQVALQSAYYNIHQRLTPCYESASTRRFAHGRTDTIRSLTKEVAQFCQDPHIETLTAAIKSHKAYALAAGNGNAIDRALFGYKMTFIELRANSWKWGLPAQVQKNSNEVVGLDGPEQAVKLENLFTEDELKSMIALFNNELIQRSIRFALSTSQVSSVHPDTFMTYGPLVADGYGCCYNITGQQMVAGITANSSNPAFSCDVHKLNESLRDSMDKMRDLVEGQK